MTGLSTLATIVDAIAIRVARLEQRSAWLEEYAATLESALMKALPPCVLGEAGPRFTVAHVEVCARCGAMAELESLPDSPLPDDGGADS
jgi:hypothetical protein